MEERWWPAKPIDLHYSRFRNLFNIEESSYQASLMAGDLPLGPSVAPCLVEASTAHDDFLLSLTVLSTRKAKSPWSPTSVCNLAHPPRRNSTHLSPPFWCSRRSQKPTWIAEAKLGFHSESGPLTLLKPQNICCSPLTFLKLKNIFCGPSSNFNWPRYDPKSFLSILSLWLCRYHAFNGRRHHLICVSPSMLWIYNYHLRTLLLDSSMASFNETKSLKIHGRLSSNPICRRCDYCHQRSLPNYYLPTTLSIDLKHRSITNTLKVQILKIMTFDSSSTSPSLLAVIIISSFVDDLAVNHDLTWGRMLSGFCLKALLEHLSSIYLLYHVVALGNALFCYVLNFGIFESLLYLVLI